MPFGRSDAVVPVLESHEVTVALSTAWRLSGLPMIEMIGPPA